MGLPRLLAIISLHSKRVRYLVRIHRQFDVKDGKHANGRKEGGVEMKVSKVVESEVKVVNRIGSLIHEFQYDPFGLRFLFVGQSVWTINEIQSQVKKKKEVKLWE